MGRGFGDELEHTGVRGERPGYFARSNFQTKSTLFQILPTAALMSSAIVLCFCFFKVSVQAPLRHWYCFKSIIIAPISERTQTIPNPTNIPVNTPVFCILCSLCICGCIFVDVIFFFKKSHLWTGVGN